MLDAHQVERAERLQVGSQAAHARPILDDVGRLTFDEHPPEVVDATSGARGRWASSRQVDLGDTRKDRPRAFVMQGPHEQQVGFDRSGQGLQEIRLADAAAAQISVGGLRCHPEGPRHGVSRFRSSS